MGDFSTSMKATAERLITSFGKGCVMTKVEKGEYVPTIGRTAELTTDYDTFSAPTKIMSAQFGLDGMNTNLAGFEGETILIPWFGQMVDKTWLYNGENIVSVQKTEAQGEIIVFTLAIASS